MRDDLEPVWKALADPTRRRILDLLRERPLIVREMADTFADEMTRYGVMKHLAVLREARLVTVRRVGRRSYHALNPVPIRLIHDRWISQYAEPWAEAVVNLKKHLEDPKMEAPRLVLETFIRATPEAVWAAMTEPEQTRDYFHATAVESDWTVGASIVYRMENGEAAVEGEIVAIDPPRRLVTTWHALYSPDHAADAPSRVTWEIDPMDGFVRLTLVHDEFDGETATYRGVSDDGWSWVIASLKSFVETGEGLPRPA